MPSSDTRRLGTHATHVAAEVRAETYHETHLPESAVRTARTARSDVPAQPAQRDQPSTVVVLPGSTPEPTINRLDHGKVVVGVDGSEYGRAALDWAAEEARRRGAELVAVAAWVPQGPMSGPMLAPGADLWAETIEATREMLNEQVKPLQGAGLTVTLHLVGGPPYEALEELSGEADLLVVGNHGRGALRRSVLGSVSRHVCRHAKCPVVVVPSVPAADS
ncbi:MAG TPA: universal stress protein [Frankiaceae bacterium]|nr:universal stress protein [Frankiaceae bacterium]